MNYTIRMANMEDVNAVNDLLTKLINDEKKYDKNINEKCIVTEMYENFIGNDKNCVLVAENNHEIIGYIFGFLENNGDAYLEKIVNLDALFVKSEYRNKGIASELINKFKKWALSVGAKYIELKVCNDNDGAISLYEEFNFKTVKSTMRLEI